MLADDHRVYLLVLMYENTTDITVVSRFGSITVNIGLTTYSISLPLILMKLPQHINNLPLLVLVFI